MKTAIRDWIKHHSAFTLSLLTLLFLVSLQISAPEFFKDLQFRVFDLFQKISPRVYHDAPVAIVDIDDASLDQLGQWPWGRDQIAQLIDQCTQSEAAAVVFDMVFAEPDRSSPKNFLAPLTKTLEAAEMLRIPLLKLPDHDKLLEEALTRSQKTILGFSLINQPNDHRPLLKAGISYLGTDPVTYLPRFKGAVNNLPELEKAAAGNGSFNILADPDGMLRRIPLFFRLEESLYPSLALEGLRVAQGASAHIIKTAGASGENAFGAQTGFVSVKTGDYTIPTDGEGKFWLYDTGPVARRFLSAWKVSSGKFDRDFLKGKIVLIGTSAEGLKDLRATPLNPVAPGVEVQAQIVEQILLDEFLHRPDWAPGLELAFLLLLGLLLVFAMRKVGALGCALISLTSILGAVTLSWYAFLYWRMLFDPVVPSVEIVLIYAVASLLNFLRTEAEKRFIRNAFSRYMSPDLVKRLSEHPAELKLGGETRFMTFLFSDIRNFTQISERFQPEELTRFLNRFLTPMTDIILKNNGTIDKYMGDSIIAFWNAPLEDKAHAFHACETALQMKNYLSQWNEEISKEAMLSKKTLPQIRMGIGINSGEACVGNMGSDQRFAYSVLGDQVNLASRIENLTKVYDADILMGENSFKATQDFAALEVDWIRVKGKNQPVKLYTLLGPKGLIADLRFQTLKEKNDALLAAFRSQHWQEALDLIKICSEIHIPGSHLEGFYSLMKSRIESFLIHPPAKDWDGIITADFK